MLGIDREQDKLSGLPLPGLGWAGLGWAGWWDAVRHSDGWN